MCVASLVTVWIYTFNVTVWIYSLKVLVCQCPRHMDLLPGCLGSPGPDPDPHI